MSEDAGDLLDNRQAQAQPAVLVRTLYIAALELLENFLQAILGDANAGIPDLDRHPLPLAPAPQHQAAAGGVADGVAQQVAQDPGE